MNDSSAKNTSDRLHSHKAVMAAFFLTALFLALAYSNTFSSPPVLDDYHTFVEQPLVRIQQWSVENLSALSGTIFRWNRWIPMFSFSVDLSLGEGEVFSFHLTNLLIHFCCFLSVFFLTYQLHCAVQDRSTASKDTFLSPSTLAIWVAGLWALHPLQTNAVTYLVQRMASLVALFIVLSVAFYLSGRLVIVRRGRFSVKAFVYFALSLIASVMALFCKENAAMIPVLLVFTEAWFFQPNLFRNVFHFLRRRWVLAGIPAVVILTVFSYAAVKYALPGYADRNFTMVQRLLTESRVLVWYISMLIWPHPGRLSFEHDVAISTSLFHPATTAISIVVLGILSWWTFARRKVHPLITYGFLWFMLNMIPESTIMPLELVFEHRMYLPSAGLVLSLIGGAGFLLSSRLSSFSPGDIRKLKWSCFAILASILTLATFQRNCAWQDGITLAEDNVLKAPNNHRSHSNLAVAYLRSQRYQEAIDQAYIAIGLGSYNSESHAAAANTIVAALASTGEFQAAIDEGERLLAERPPGINVLQLPSFHLNMAFAYESIGNLEAAVNSVRQALFITYRSPAGQNGDLKSIGRIRLEKLLSRAAEENVDLDHAGMQDSNRSSVATRMAKELLGLGDRGGAMDFLKKAVEENVDDTEGKQLLETILREDELNADQEMRKDYSLKYVRQPFSPFNACMAVAFLIQKHQGLAPFLGFGEIALNWALQMRPDSADAHLLKGYYHYSKNEALKAVEEAQYVLRLDPEYAKAWMGLGLFLVKANRPQEAMASLHKSLELHPGLPQRPTVTNLIASLQAPVEPVNQSTQ